MRFHRVTSLLAAAGLVAASAMAATAAVPTPTPGTLTRHTITASYVSGVSSGGYMATQLHVAYSGTIKGAAIFAAGPYGCAQGNLTTALTACSGNSTADDLPRLEQSAADRSASGRIDPIGGLSGQKVWVFHGGNDTTVQRSVTDDLAAFYTHFGAAVTYDHTSPAAHAWVSPLGPNPCTSSYTPYLNDCGDDPEGEMLATLLGSVAAPASAPVGTLVSFSQKAYVPDGTDPASISMGSTGFAYVPPGCDGGTGCVLMVALHGCLQSYDNAAVGDRFLADAGLNEYADTNHMIVLYPQATAVSSGNPQGCWNWWGYLGDTAYDAQGGAQLETIMNMVRALGGGPTGGTPAPTPTPSPAPLCVTADNYTHTTAGRAHQSGGYAYANGSGDPLGLWNTFTVRTLRQTGPGYWARTDGSC
ncbi:PHB depolymerase family esterase [Actinoallomurus sp. NPDC050550]|uniref:extracellular catalytic domain type 2 short-chain-length polyhydroxyalkanoate depolymerase n=1 Tax=Actinoallomurus sp. NPDC050550 TaxID=3154937 RepID=UPI0033C4DB19